jgi:hypothetical protein
MIDIQLHPSFPPIAILNDNHLVSLWFQQNIPQLYSQSNLTSREKLLLSWTAKEYIKARCEFN